jgi:broad specificity phosphatase PhoE
VVVSEELWWFYNKLMHNDCANGLKNKREIIFFAETFICLFYRRHVTIASLFSAWACFIRNRLLYSGWPNARNMLLTNTDFAKIPGWKKVFGRRRKEYIPMAGVIRIILVRHGRPAISTNHRTGHRGFSAYIDAYEAAGLDPTCVPPEEVQDLVGELDLIYTSGKPRSQDSARALAPDAELIADPLFVEAPLASPHIPLLRIKVPAWAVMARILWHAGYHPEIENYRRTKQRAKRAADILTEQARKNGAAALVAHGYFNAIIGRELRRRGFRRIGAHRVTYWNAVIYELS